MRMWVVGLLLLAGCRTAPPPSAEPPAMLWREIALVETNQPGAPRVDYRVQWPVGGARGPLLQAVQGQIRVWLAMDGAPASVDRQRDVPELLRRRAQALQRVQEEDRAVGTAALPYVETLSIAPVYGGRGVLSLRRDLYCFTGGAHGNPSKDFAVFRMSDGHRLILSDLVTPAAREPLAELIKAGLRRQHGLGPSDVLAEAGFWEKNIQAGDQFYLDEQGLWFFYNVYEIAPYAMGDFAVRVDYRDLQPWAQPEGPLARSGGLAP